MVCNAMKHCGMILLLKSGLLLLSNATECYAMEYYVHAQCPTQPEKKFNSM